MPAPTTPQGSGQQNDDYIAYAVAAIIIVIIVAYAYAKARRRS